MGSEWNKQLLGSLCHEITVGFVGSMTQEYVPTGVPFLRSKNIAEYDIDWNDMKYVSKEFHSKLSKSVLKPGDVAIVRTGKPGTTCVVPADLVEANCSDIVIARVNAKLLNPHYLTYFMNAMAHGQVNAHVVGAVQQHFNVGSAKKIEIPLPSILEQEKVVNVLKALDDKFKLNNQINQTLEQIAQTLFKSWFVDFDPVKAKMNGEQPKGMDAATASLFPEKLVESELGLIPEGWSVRPLGSLIDFMTGFAFKSKQFTESGVRLARGDNVKEGRFHWGDKSRYWPVVTPELEKYHLQSGDILIGMDGSKVGKNWVRVNESDLPCLLVQRVARLREKGLVGSSMLEVIIGGNKFKRYVENVKTGTSIPHISGKQIKDMPILYPNDGGKLFQRFEELLLPLAQKRELNNVENQELTRLRDTLLPKLLSGEIDLENVQIEQAKALAE